MRSLDALIFSSEFLARFYPLVETAGGYCLYSSGVALLPGVSGSSQQIICVIIHKGVS